MQAGAFRIGDTAGTLDNIVACKLYRPGSVGFVSKSGGMSNEMYNVLSRATDGLYEGACPAEDPMMSFNVFVCPTRCTTWCRAQATASTKVHGLLQLGVAFCSCEWLDLTDAFDSHSSAAEATLGNNQRREIQSHAFHDMEIRSHRHRHRRRRVPGLHAIGSLLPLPEHRRYQAHRGARRAGRPGRVLPGTPFPIVYWFSFSIFLF